MIYYYQNAKRFLLFYLASVFRLLLDHIHFMTKQQKIMKNNKF